MVGDNTPAILNAAPNVRISNPDSSYEDYVNQANEKHAQTWDFRGNNSNLKDDQGNYYIDPNRQLTPEDISNMRSKGAKIPEQWESLKDADISELTKKMVIFYAIRVNSINLQTVLIRIQINGLELKRIVDARSVKETLIYVVKKKIEEVKI